MHDVLLYTKTCWSLRHGCSVHSRRTGAENQLKGSSGDKWLFEDHTVFAKRTKAGWKGSFELWRWNLKRLSLVPFCLPHESLFFCGLLSFPRVSLDGNTEAERRGLGEQLPDLSVNVAKEVQVGGATVQTFILHQELTEQHLWLVPLPHDLKLRGPEVKKLFYSRWFGAAWSTF